MNITEKLHQQEWTSLCCGTREREMISLQNSRVTAITNRKENFYKRASAQNGSLPFPKLKPQKQID